jgi:hypothetical protein
MVTASRPVPVGPQPIHGQIIEAEAKSSVDATRPLPLVCSLYAIEAPGGIWLCAYYGVNRSLFDYLPQKGMIVDESTLGIVFHVKEFIAKDKYQPAVWEEFRKKRMMAYSGHGE